MIFSTFIDIFLNSQFFVKYNDGKITTLLPESDIVARDAPNGTWKCMNNCT